ncbi:MAG TPA: DEAD/DEAH box helicase, partial [Gemmatimonadales bacterium]|nr:DEAD/DEAH box helicase [Gemmatimonadales bacterium]
MAESLSMVRDPLAAWLKPGPVAEPQAVAAALAKALLPPEADEPLPAWLRPDQRLSFRRAVAAVRRFNGVLLADGVGTGKTWIALAVAQALDPRRSISVLAPAGLLAQWREVAARAGVPIRVHSHETLSRGRLPTASGSVVIVDESHRFRNAATRRYHTVAPWCVGRRGILLSATPAVNRLEDVVHQLLLFVRDDALAWNGVPSLREGLGRGVPDALAHLMVTGEDRSRFLPARASRELSPAEPEGAPFWTVLRGMGGLRLSANPMVAALIRVTILQALASSPAAMALALSRYRRLLLSAQDAGDSGVLPSRESIWRLVGADADQLVLWPMVAEAAAAPELALSDLAVLYGLGTACRAFAAAPDAKLAALTALLSDEKPTLVFTTHVATVGHLRAGLCGRRIAWCTGAAAGLDRAVLPRDTVLDWFRRPLLRADDVQPRPRLLIATDVAAEGLDLPLVERVVHYDLPWTAVRLDQRAGRAFRLGSVARSVEVIRIRPPRALEDALGREVILDAKASMPGCLGLGNGADAPWRVRARVAAQWFGIETREGTAIMAGSRGVVVGVRIATGAGPPREIIVARTGTTWVTDGATIAEILERARGEPIARLPDPARIRMAVRGLSGLVRGILRAIHGAPLAPAPRPAPVQAAMRRL